ncbi:ATP-binding protein [Gallaecimonas kandeliae]|uniref:sensor histidine kinase n=1 Tax=Gallaecimonas kandeliae TaxID=3029055 RepID=UPI0026481079|nr:ATP-binding protein [Gallaecimonas kandeliae]WKE66339.1 ATP-binding protein [Gallaecimonas kandeliae]
MTEQTTMRSPDSQARPHPAVTDGPVRQTILSGQSISSVQTKATQALAIATIVLITPFAVNNFVQGRTLVGVLSVVIGVILGINAWTAGRGRHYPAITLFVLIPAIVAFFVTAFLRQGLVAAFWCYPAVLAFYFMLSERQAWGANLILLCAMLPSAWLLIEPGLAIRFTVTLIAVSLFSAIFMRIVSVQQQQLSQREQLRREGMASVSHELRTPLAMLLAQAEAMREGIRPRDDAQFEKLSRSMEHLNGLVDDLYQLTLADAGALHCGSEPVNWTDTVFESIEASREQFREKALALQVNLEDKVMVLGDEKRLRQTLDNLLGNCLRYCPAGCSVNISLTTTSRQARLVVSDDGPGVDDQIKDMLFDRFYRAEASRSRKSGGAGLGLSLVKAFTEAQGGSVEAVRAMEGGLEIRLTLPLHRHAGVLS